METLHIIKTGALSFCGLIASLAVESMGGYDHFMRTLIFFMAIDFITGWMAAITVGKLSSRAGFKGFIKKGCMLLIIVVSVFLDGLMATNELMRDAVIIAFILNELISILENAGRMGIKMPDVLKNSLELLSKGKVK